MWDGGSMATVRALVGFCRPAAGVDDVGLRSVVGLMAVVRLGGGASPNVFTKRVGRVWLVARDLCLFALLCPGAHGRAGRLGVNVPR